jgi:hypothetical protein
MVRTIQYEDPNKNGIGKKGLRELKGDENGPFVVPKNESGVAQSAGTQTDPNYTVLIDENGLVQGEVGYTPQTVTIDDTTPVDVTLATALDSDTDSVTSVTQPAASIGHGIKNVTTAGTDVALAASTACKYVIVQARYENTSKIAVGGSGVDATATTGTGIILENGDSIMLDVDNLADVYIDSLVNGDGVRFTYGVA